jgi:hypothetical protein
VSGQNIRAFNFGYFHYIGERSRIGVDYQFKNGVSYNDDFINTRFQIIWNVIFGRPGDDGKPSGVKDVR